MIEDIYNPCEVCGGKLHGTDGRIYTCDDCPIVVFPSTLFSQPQAPTEAGKKGGEELTRQLEGEKR